MTVLYQEYSKFLRITLQSYGENIGIKQYICVITIGIINMFIFYNQEVKES